MIVKRIFLKICENGGRLQKVSYFFKHPHSGSDNCRHRRNSVPRKLRPPAGREGRKEGRKERKKKRRKKGRKEERKKGRKEGRKEGRKKIQLTKSYIKVCFK